MNRITKEDTQVLSEAYAQVLNEIPFISHDEVGPEKIDISNELYTKLTYLTKPETGISKKNLSNEYLALPPESKLKVIRLFAREMLVEIRERIKKHGGVHPARAKSGTYSYSELAKELAPWIQSWGYPIKRADGTTGKRAIVRPGLTSDWPAWLADQVCKLVLQPAKAIEYIAAEGEKVRGRVNTSFSAASTPDELAID